MDTGHGETEVVKLVYYYSTFQLVFIIIETTFSLHSKSHEQNIMVKLFLRTASCQAFPGGTHLFWVLLTVLLYNLDRYLIHNYYTSSHFKLPLKNRKKLHWMCLCLAPYGREITKWNCSRQCEETGRKQYFLTCGMSLRKVKGPSNPKCQLGYSLASHSANRHTTWRKMLQPFLRMPLGWVLCGEYTRTLLLFLESVGSGGRIQQITLAKFCPQMFGINNLWGYWKLRLFHTNEMNYATEKFHGTNATLTYSAFAQVTKNICSFRTCSLQPDLLLEYLSEFPASGKYRNDLRIVFIFQKVKVHSKTLHIFQNSHFLFIFIVDRS